MNINDYENREMAKLAGACGPAMMVLGGTGPTGPVLDVLIAAVGALATSYAILWGLR